MADIFPGGINALNKDPGIVGVLDMQRRARDSGAARGSQMASNFMQGRKMKQDAAMEERQMSAEEGKVKQADYVAGFILNGGLPPNFSDPSAQMGGEEFPSEQSETPGVVEGQDNAFPAGMSNSMKLQATMGRLRMQGEITRAQDARNKAAQELNLGKARVEVGDMVNTALKDGTIWQPEFKRRLFELSGRTPDVASTPQFTQALTQHNTAFEVHQALTPKAVTDIRGLDQAATEAEASGRPDLAGNFRAAMPQSPPSLEEKTREEIAATWEMRGQLRKASEFGDMVAVEAFRKKLGLTEAEVDSTVKKAQAYEGVKAMPDSVPWKATALSALEQDMKIGKGADLPEPDKVALRKWTNGAEPIFKSALDEFQNVGGGDLNWTTVGPLRGFYDKIDTVGNFLGAAMGASVPGSIKRAEAKSKLTAAFMAARDAFVSEGNPSDKEGRRIDAMLQSEDFWTSPQKVSAAFKQTFRTLENRMSEGRKGVLRILPDGHPEQLRLLQEEDEYLRRKK